MALENTRVSAVNSSSAPLGVGGVFTGAFEDVSTWTSVQSMTRSDVAGTMTFQWSPDGTNIDRSVAITVDDVTGVYYSSGIRARYLRVIYTNGGSAQAYLRMQITYSPGTDYPGISQVSETPSGRAPAWNVKAHPFAPDSGGTYQHLEAGAGTAATALRTVIASDQTAVPVSASSLPLPTGASTAALQTQPGVDIGDVTINNAAGASAVNIQDGGNSLTVDGTVAATQSGTWNVGLSAGANNIGDVDILSIAAGDNNIGNVDVVTLPSLPAGTNNIGDVDVLTLPTLPAGTNYIGKARLTDGTTDAEVVPLAGYNAQAVAIVDGSGSQITSFGGGTQYTEDAAAPADPVGTAVALVRADTPAAITGTDGDIVAQRATNYGAAYVTLLDTAGNPVSVGGGTQYTEDVAAAADPIGTMVMAVRADALAAVTSTDGDNIAARSTNNGELYVKHVDTIPVTQSGTWNVTNVSGTVSLPTGAATAANQLADGHNVTVDNAAGGSAVNIQDGGNSITVDGSVSISGAVDTELPAAVLLADNASTPTAPAVGSFGMLYDGANWDMARGTSADGALVNLGTNNDVTVTGTLTTVSTVTSLTQMNGQAISMNTGVRDAGTQRVTIATNDSVPVTLTSTTVTGTVAVTQSGTWDEVGINDSGNSITVDAPVGTPVNVQIGNATLSVGVIDETGAAAVDALAIGGGTAHDAVDSGNPVKVGGVAVSGSATPTSVASGDRVRFIANQHGIPYGIGGHPNLITREFDFGTTAQTNFDMGAAAVAADERIYITRFEAMCDNANTVAVSVRAGFGAASVPAASATGVSGMIASHPGIAAGSGIVCGNGAGIIAVGAAGEEPRLTTSVATSGNLHVIISYFLIDETP